MEKILPKDKITEWTQWNVEQQEYKKVLLKKYIKKMNSDKVPILPLRSVPKKFINFVIEINLNPENLN